MKHDSWKKKSYLTLFYIKTKCDLRDVSSSIESTTFDVHFALSGSTLIISLHSGIEMIQAKKTNAPRVICARGLNNQKDSWLTAVGEHPWGRPISSYFGSYITSTNILPSNLDASSYFKKQFDALNWILGRFPVTVFVTFLRKKENFFLRFACSPTLTRFMICSEQSHHDIM